MGARLFTSIAWGLLTGTTLASGQCAASWDRVVGDEYY